MYQEEYQKQFLRDTFEVIKARARYLKNLRDFYKWSIAAGLTGILGGLGAILFNFTLNISLTGFKRLIVLLPDPRLIAIIPALGGLLAGIVRYLTVPEAFNSCCATDNMIDIVHRENGQTKVRTPFATIATAALTIGSGGSAGRECPTALIGTGFGSISSKIIRKLRLNKFFGFQFEDSDIRTLAICGASAGLGAIFRAPIGAALFSSSVLYVYGMEIETILPALISSVTAYLIFSGAYGFEPLFRAPFIWEFNFFDLFLVVVIGVAASLAGLLYIKVFHGVFRRFRSFTIPDYIKPAIGGLLTGLLILVVPRVWGMGYETIQDAINYKLAISLLLILIFAKIIATSFSIGSGGAGGVIAPSLFIGAALGGSLGRLAMILFPKVPLHPALYVIAGMGALYASVGKVPLATAILLCEATRNFTMIIPLITANISGFLASSRYTIYESQHADATREKMDILRAIEVGKIMQKDIVAVSPEISVNEFLKKIRETQHHGYPVLENGKLIGVVSWHDTRHIPLDKRDEVKVGQIMTKNVIFLSPNNQAREALDLLDEHKIGRVIVVDPTDPNTLVGMVTRQDILKAYLKMQELHE